ncbi:MAG: hypothetical protein ACYC38_13535, partial [Eubacteriales bacterium]
MRQNPARPVLGGFPVAPRAPSIPPKTGSLNHNKSILFVLIEIFITLADLCFVVVNFFVIKVVNFLVVKTKTIFHQFP